MTPEQTSLLRNLQSRRIVGMSRGDRLARIKNLAASLAVECPCQDRAMRPPTRISGGVRRVRAALVAPLRLAGGYCRQTMRAWTPVSRQSGAETIGRTSASDASRTISMREEWIVTSANGGGSTTSDTVRIGVVGFGGSGSRHALAFSHLPGVEVTAVVDPIQGEQVASTIGATYYEDDLAFLRGRNYDALFVATPDAPEPEDAIKVEWARLMLDHPDVHALWERPIGLDEDEWSTITASIRSAKFAANYFLRFGAYRTVLAAIDRGEIQLGEIQSICVINSLNDGLDHKRWRFSPRAQLPVIFLDHVFDLLSFLRLPAVTALTAHRQMGELLGKPIDVAWEVLLELENGGRGYIGTSQYSGPTEHFRPMSLFHIQGSAGWLRVSGRRAHFVGTDGREVEITPEWSTEASAAASAVERFITEEQGVPPASAVSESKSLAEHAWYFIKWIRGEVDQGPLASADDALRALRLGLATIRSADEGERVETVAFQSRTTRMTESPSTELADMSS